jgi:hypothetical protein
MAESILPGAIHRETEFVGNLTGACGPNALSMGVRWSTQAGQPATYDVYTDMYRRGLCAASGASTLDALHQEASNLGMPLTAYRGYGEPWPADGVSGWRAFYLAHAGHSYILMETANGQALRDSISGQGENATNLHYHFIGIVGYHAGGFSVRAGRDLPVGWWAVDGDNFAAGDVLQYYPDAILAAAQPCGALAFAAKVSIPMAGVPGGWRDANGVLTAPNGGTVGHGFRQHILDAAAWPAALMPLTGEYGTPARQDFALSLVWGQTAANEVVGPNWPALNTNLEAQIAALKAANAAEEAGETTPTVDPQTAKDAALGKGLRALLVEAAA